MRSAVGLIRRRGSIISWEHATPASGGAVNPDSRELDLSIGGPRVPLTPMGEAFSRKYLVRAYVSHKISSFFTEVFGAIDQRDAQLDFAYPFAPEIENGIVLPAYNDLRDYNDGKFVRFTQNDPNSPDVTLDARDRFTIAGQRFYAKSAAVSITDRNRVVAWRILIGADTLSRGST